MTAEPNLDPIPTAHENARALDLAMSTYPAGWERDSLARRAAQAFAAERVRLLTPPPPSLVRVTIERDAYTGWTGAPIPPKTITQDFENFAEAADWVHHDGYISEDYTRRVVIEHVEVTP